MMLLNARNALTISAWLAFAGPALAEPQKPTPATKLARASGSANITPVEAEPEMLWEGGTWLEGPAVAPSGEVYFSDIIEVWKPGKLGVIRVYDPKTRQTRLFRSPSYGSNGLLFDAKGNLLAAHGAAYGGRYITRTDMATNMSEVVAGLYNGRPLNSPNDMALDKNGRIYFTDPRYGGHERVEQPVTGVYRVDSDGRVNLIIADLARPNGIAISADNKKLYVVEADGSPAHAPATPATGRVRIYCYDLASGGTVSNKRLFRNYDKLGVLVDGIKTDEDGNLYVTEMASTPGIRVIGPYGEEVKFIPTPDNPVNLTFARVDGNNWLYFTSATRLYRLRMKIGGH